MSGHSRINDEQRQRLLESLKRNLGPGILGGLNNPEIIEVMLNPDGCIWFDYLGKGMMDSGYTLSSGAAHLVMESVAAMLGFVVTRENPILEGEFPLDGSRFAGVLPPVVDAPTFAIRKKAIRIFSLDDYSKPTIPVSKDEHSTDYQKLTNDYEFTNMVNAYEDNSKRGIMTIKQAYLLKQAVKNAQNILVIGGTGSGKTTLINALLHEMSILCGAERVIIIEDTRELQCAVKNKVMLRTTEFVDITALLRLTMRLRPDRICVGEVRGKEALALLKAWNSGHSGGSSTIHADSVADGLAKLDEYVQEANVPSKIKLIGRAVHFVVFIEKTATGRKISEMGVVKGYSRELEEVIIEMV